MRLSPTTTKDLCIKTTLYQNEVDDDCGYHEHALRTAIRDLRRLTIA